MTYEEHYRLCLENNCSPALADMLASRSFPATKGTDRAFMQGRKLGGGQFDGVPYVGEHHLRKAREAGVSTTGKYYCGSLASYPGDPAAWVDSTHDIRRICTERGWDCDGAVKVEAPRYAGDTPAPYRVADDIVDEHVARVLEERPELVPRALEIREEVQGRLSGVHG